MKTKVLLLGFLAVSGILLLHSCLQPKHKPVIGLLMDDFVVERWATDTACFIKEVNAEGGKVICLAAHGNAETQAEQAKSLIARKIDVLVILPVNVDKAADIVAYAKQKSTPVISYDRLIQNSFVDYYVSFDNVKVGELQANYIQNRMGNGSIALINGPTTDKNSVFLHYGQMGVLQPYIENNSIHIVFDRYVNEWTLEEGYRLAKECLLNRKVDAIIAGNDLLARGVIKALEEMGLAGKVLVAGQDGDSYACENIIKGIQTMSVYKPVEDLAVKAAVMAMDLASNKSIDYASFTVDNGYKMVPSLLIAPTVVNKGNIGMKVKVEKK